jgi:hypothetical protein
MEEYRPFTLFNVMRDSDDLGKRHRNECLHNFGLASAPLPRRALFESRDVTQCHASRGSGMKSVNTVDRRVAVLNALLTHTSPYPYANFLDLLLAPQQVLKVIVVPERALSQ